VINENKPAIIAPIIAPSNVAKPISSTLFEAMTRFLLVIDPVICLDAG
jgi:hypothetical protein